MSRFRKIVNRIGVLALIGGISYCSYNYASAEKRLRGTCAQIQSGMTVDQLSEFSESRGLGPLPRHSSGTVFLVEKKTFGRYGCKVTMKDGLVTEAEFSASN